MAKSPSSVSTNKLTAHGMCPRRNPGRGSSTSALYRAGDRTSTMVTLSLSLSSPFAVLVLPVSINRLSSSISIMFWGSMRPIFTILVADAFFHFVLMRQKERGVGVNNQKWGIEMNNAQQLYLMTYGVIDTIDTIDVLIKKCDMYYRSWKYWHSAKNHFLALAVVVAYDMYKECKSEAFEEFDLTEEQAKRSLLNFHEFREKLSTQGLKYHPKDQRYPGDSRMRPNTQLNKKRLATQLAK